MERNEFRYFNPYINPFDGKTQAEKREYAKYAKRDYERMESLNKGNWCFLHVSAEATVIIGSVIEKISSGGIGGVESDGDFTDIEKEELAALTDILKALGFKESQICKVKVQEAY